MLDRSTHGDLVRILNLATRCLSARTIEDVKDVISGLGELISFRKAALCALPATGSQPPLEHFINHSYGGEWAELYTRERMERVDPVVRYGRSTDGAFRWRDALTMARNGASATFLVAARDFGLVKGVSYSCACGPTSIRTLLSLSDADNGDSDRAVEILTALGPHVHECYKRVLRARPDAVVPTLSPRETEVLRWTQQGKTYWEVGCILGISQRTVKYHFARIKEKLDVVSVSHAVAKAMRSGIID